jgi:hypothetical protein
VHIIDTAVQTEHTAFGELCEGVVERLPWAVGVSCVGVIAVDGIDDVNITRGERPLAGHGERTLWSVAGKIRGECAAMPHDERNKEGEMANTQFHTVADLEEGALKDRILILSKP